MLAGRVLDTGHRLTCGGSLSAMERTAATISLSMFVEAMQRGLEYRKEFLEVRRLNERVGSERQLGIRERDVDRKPSVKSVLRRQILPRIQINYYSD